MRLHGRSLMTFVLTPTIPITDWLTEIDKRRRTSPAFFVGRPIILDLAAVSLNESQIGELIKELDERGIRVMALEGTEDDRLGPSLPPVLKRGRATGSEAPGSFSEKGAARTPRRQEPSSLLIENPVRSGQSIIFPNGDITVLGAALAQAGQKVAVVDFDVGLRNLDLVMGAERRVVFDFINVVQGVAKLSQALIRDKRLETLWLLPASQTRDKDALTEEGVASIINELRGQFDWVICDSPAGIERGATLAMRFADTAVIVTNPEVSSVRDSDRIIGLLDSKTEKAENGQRVDKHVLITRYDAQRAARGEMLNIEDVLEILSTPLLGIIPESEEILRASNLGSPITINNATSAPARAYLDAARRLKGDEVPMSIPNDRKGLLDKLFGRRAA